MSDLSQMEVKQLRNEVQLLRDELAIFKRKYEDIIYNLDDDNFSSTLLREKDGMKTSIEINAEGIKTKVSNAEFESAKTQLAGEITSKVNTLDNKLSSQISQTATEINQKVDNVESDLSSEISQTAAAINTKVSNLSSSVSSVSQTANSFSSRITNLENFKTSTFNQTADGFLLDGEKSGFTGYIYLADKQGNKKFTMFYDDSQGYEQIMFHDCVVGTIPIVIGDDGEDVYLGMYANGKQVATREWVEKNGGGGGGTATAVFG